MFLSWLAALLWPLLLACHGWRSPVSTRLLRSPPCSAGKTVEHREHHLQPALLIQPSTSQVPTNHSDKSSLPATGCHCAPVRCKRLIQRPQPVSGLQMPPHSVHGCARGSANWYTVKWCRSASHPVCCVDDFSLKEDLGRHKYSLVLYQAQLPGSGNLQQPRESVA